jgi:hypothetical protein
MISGSITNRGTIRADAGGQIRVSGGSLTNAVGGVLSADGGTLSLATDWFNAGRIVVNNSTLNLGGSFTTDGIGSITRTGGTINLVGLLDNTGSTLVLDATTGSWNLNFGFAELRGGNLVTSGSAALVFTDTNTSGTLNGVTLGGTIGGVPASATVLGNSTSPFIVTGGLTFADGSLLDTRNTMALVSDQTVGGDGEIRFRGSGGITNYNHTTFGPRLTIHRSDTARSDINLVSGSITNQATIRADAGGEIRVTGIDGTSFTNAVGGVLTTASGTLTLGGTWSNTGAFQVTGGTLNLGGAFTTAGMGTVTNDGRGIIKLTGTLDNTGSTLALDDATGSWYLEGGSIVGGRVSTTGTSELVGLSTNALAGLAANTAAGRLRLDNGANLTTSAGSFNNQGSLTVGAGSTFTAATVTVANGGNLNGAGTIAANVINNGAVNPGASPATFRVNGSYTQGAGGVLDLGIGGTTPGSGHDQLRISGAANLDGAVNISLIDGFGAATGQRFEVMTFAGHNGAFSAVNGLSQGRFPLFNLVVNPANVVLNALANGTDLAIDSFQSGTIPPNAMPGQMVSLTYTVKNLSDPSAVGNWIDSVYLSRAASSIRATPC